MLWEISLNEISHSMRIQVSSKSDIFWTKSENFRMASALGMLDFVERNLLGGLEKCWDASKRSREGVLVFCDEIGENCRIDGRKSVGILFCVFSFPRWCAAIPMDENLSEFFGLPMARSVRRSLCARHAQISEPCSALCIEVASGHTATNTPDLFRTPKLTVAGPGQYWGGGPPGKPFGCC